ncbi:MAG: hypothetical protein H0T45_15595 [Pyrinomonadaceae bacterium]|nr:hypothetical protein [Pyrinomonadaceae bacterium]
MPAEKRTRVEIFIPLRSDAADYQTITEWLAEELAYARGGSTLTTPFTGLYTSTTQSHLVRDAVHILFCDFDLDVDDEQQRAELSNYLNEIRLLLMDVLSEEEVWIVYYPIMRVGGP